MKTLTLAALVFVVGTASAAEAPQPDRSKVLYALGAKMVKDYNLKADDVKTVIEGMTECSAGKELKADPKELRLPIMLLQREADESRRLAVLAGYAKEPGAKSFPSGLIFKEITKGTGAKPLATSTVKVHYHGTFPDGSVFDSSVQRGQQIEFPLNGVIPCWTEGVQMIAVGGKAQLVCPHTIAYGERGRGGIPERATLVFEVELFEVK